jgi:hypothetical protein
MARILILKVLFALAVLFTVRHVHRLLELGDGWLALIHFLLAALWIVIAVTSLERLLRVGRGR